MKLATFAIDGRSRPGLVVAEGLVDIVKHLPAAPAQLMDLIASWERFAPRIVELETLRPDVSLDVVRLQAPITRPGKILALGMNYRDHCAEANLPIPKFQSWFVKAGTAVNGPYGAIELPAVSEQLDYEAELIVVIGKRARSVAPAQAASVVFGYCVGNDVSVRDWQLRTTQHCVGKSFDKAAPFGPWITTADSVDSRALWIRSHVNGELRQNSNTEQFVFSVNEMVSYLSQAMTLEPGDLLFTGTPGGVGYHWPGGPAFLREGDNVRVEIEGLGAIENRVARGSGLPQIG